MSININSEAWCRKAYLNYHCYGNSMNISAEEMGEITKRWESRLTSWQTTVSNDENQYEFDDSDYAKSKEDGKNKGEKATDGKPNTTAGAIQSYGSGVAALGSAVCGVLAICGVAATPMLWVAAGLCAAVPLIYYAHKPNKDGKGACDDMQNELANTQAALSDTQADMEQMANEIIDLADQANEANEDANDDIEEQKTEYDMYKASYEALKAKVESGEPLTEEEKVLYQELIKYMSGAAEGINKTQVDTTDLVAGIYDDMGTYQEGYDYAAETMGEAEGLTDYAASFDEKVRSNCYAAETSLYMNVGASGIIATKLALDGNIFTKPISAVQAVVATAAGVASKIAAGEQHDWAGQVGTEIDMRKDTQSFNTETMDMYTEEIDAYDGHMTGVEDLELEMPDDVEVPEDTAIPPTTGDGLPEGTPDPIKPDGNNGTENEPPNNASNGYTSSSSIIAGEADSSEVVLDENTGKVKLSKQYANAITQALGLPNATNGEVFDSEKIPDIISKLTPGLDAETIRNVMNGGTVNSSFDAIGVTIFGKSSDKTIDNSQYYTQKINDIINFYKPILEQAANAGWTCG